MDIVAHALWTGAVLAAVHRRRPLTAQTALMTLALAVTPDLIHLLPMTAWSLFGDGSITQLWHYAVALPGQEPQTLPIINSLTHHLHCIFHSAIIAGIVSLLAWLVVGRIWIPLLGWWSHIVIDIPTHSADFYPSPVLYPITQRGFDGVAWNTPWFVVLNYSALCVVGIYLAWLYGWRRSKT